MTSSTSSPKVQVAKETRTVPVAPEESAPNYLTPGPSEPLRAASLPDQRLAL